MAMLESSVAKAAQKGIPSTTLAAESADPFPCVNNIWTLFSKKGSRSVFLSIGSSQSSAPDLELAETLACPVHVVPLGQEQREAWTETLDILKTRTRPAEAKYPFSTGAEEKWILPKNVRIVETLPWWTGGSQELAGFTTKTAAFFDVVHDICKEMKLANGEVRLDILKIDTGLTEGLERAILYAMLEAGFRPAILLVKWSKMPDTDVPTTMCAGHLQNCGYSLVKKIDNKFAYFFVDQDIYMMSSWEDTSVPNPLVKEIVESVQKSLTKAELANSNARRANTAVSSCGAATQESSNEEVTDRS